jgi:catechol 2,3-dioxygenase-like lactoylglutathione lyase family enzyme
MMARTDDVGVKLCITMQNKSTLIPELKVTNFRKSLYFYTQLLGFAVLYDRPEEDFAMLFLNGARLMIEGLEKSRTWMVGDLEKPFGRGLNLQIEVSDVDALYNSIIGANYPIYLEMEEKWYQVQNTQAGNRQFLVQDPDGYLLRFFQDLTG